MTIPHSLISVMACMAVLPLHAEIRLEKEALDLRPEPLQDEIRTSVSFSNAGNSSVKVTRVKPLCDCTDASLKGGKKEYAPGEKGEIELTMRLGAFTGKIEKFVEVRTSDGKTQKLALRVDIPELMKVQPKALQWTLGQKPKAQEFTIDIDPKVALKLTDVSLVGSDFDYEPVTVAPGRKYRVVVTPKSTAKGAFNTLWIKTDSKDPRYAKRSFFLSVNPPRK